MSIVLNLPIVNLFYHGYTMKKKKKTDAVLKMLYVENVIVTEKRTTSTTFLKHDVCATLYTSGHGSVLT